MKKRILSLVLVLTIIIATSIPAFAATYSTTGSYTGTTGTCTYHAYATCSSSSWNALVEWTGSTDSYANYMFKTSVLLWVSDGSGGYTLGDYYDGVAATLIGQNSGSCTNLCAIDASFRINNTEVKNVDWLRAS